MDKFIIKGGKRLHGEVVISGAKNAAVAIIPAVAMAESPCRIENVPNISDVKLSARILTEMVLLLSTSYHIFPCLSSRKNI